MNKNILFYFLISMFLIGCYDSTIILDNNKTSLLSFEELPKSVKSVIENNLGKIDSKGEFYISTDSNIVFGYGSGGAGDTWFSSIYSNKNHFFINGWHLTLKGNKGEPFILDERYNLYYCEELNFSISNYKEYKFIKIPLYNVVYDRPD